MTMRTILFMRTIFYLCVRTIKSSTEESVDILLSVGQSLDELNTIIHYLYTDYKFIVIIFAYRNVEP